MGSVKLKDLKAFVRYDGSGRVVAGSLVFRKKKPKNGRWQEITKNLCCNPNPNPTTTTTTSGGGGVTPTAWVVTIYASSEDACANIPFTTVVGYTANSTAGIGTTIWANAALTIPLSTPNFYTSITLGGDPNVYSIATMQTTFITSIYPCTPTLYASNISPIDACAGGGVSLSTYSYSGGTTFCDCTSMNSANAAVLSNGLYNVSDGVNVRTFIADGGGSTLLTAFSSCSACG